MTVQHINQHSRKNKTLSFNIFENYGYIKVARVIRIIQMSTTHVFQRSCYKYMSWLSISVGGGDGVGGKTANQESDKRTAFVCVKPLGWDIFQPY